MDWHLLLLLVIALPTNASTKKALEKKNFLEEITDLKALKKLLRSRINILIFFAPNVKNYPKELNLLRDAASEVRGFGALALVDCEASTERKKLCKKLKVTPETYVLKHYKDGDFHKDYDRQMVISSLVKFMRDPTGDKPWDEDPIGKDILHFSDYVAFQRHLLKDSRPMMVMFYVNWCAYCKHLKLPFSKAASELKDKGHVLAAMDLDKKENTQARHVFNITGFPTLAYFKNGKLKERYNGEHNKEALVNFMLNPKAEQKDSIKKETSWSSDANSEIVHLTKEGFDAVISDEKSVLVMFYAPWCGHCKNMKPEYEKAAEYMKNNKIAGILAAIDTVKEATIGERFEIRGYPTLKYFVYGEYKFDVNLRKSDELIKFMTDPKEPPPPDKQWEDEEDSEDIIFLNEENFSKTLRRKRHALVIFFVPWCTHCKKAKPEFTAAAKALKDDTRITFCAIDCVLHSKLCAQFEVRSYPTIKYFSYLKIQQEYTGGRTSKDFIEFITNAANTQNIKEDL